MALTRELVRILDDKEEPLSKRLKIADNVFKSVGLPIQNRESFLLRWLTQVAKKDDQNAWSLLLNWLSSPNLQDLQKVDVSRDDIKSLMKVLSKSLHKSDDNLNLIVECAVALIKNKNFYFFFKHELDAYCRLVSSVFFKIEEAERLRSLLQSDQLFNRNITTGDEFFVPFFKNLFKHLGETLHRFRDNDGVFQDFSRLVERCIFQRNYEKFNNYFKTIFEDCENVTSALPQLLLENLQNLSDDNNARHIFKLIFHSYCSCYNNFKMVYQLFVILVQMLGFDAASYFGLTKLLKVENATCDLKLSTSILACLCEVLTKKTNQLKCEINKISFGDLLKNLTTTIVGVSKCPDENVYDFLRYFLTIDPLSVENIVDQIVVFVFLSPNKADMREKYDTFFVSLINVFQKLNRIPNLVSKMLPSIGKALKGNFQYHNAQLKFVGNSDQPSETSYNSGDAFSEEILNCMTRCITSLHGKQYMNLFKTFLYLLKEVINTEPMNLDKNEILYVEVIGVLLCNLLSSVRVAEHTISSITVKNFMKEMSELEENLGTFGKILVNSKHNQILMRTYLNICYTWGELYITIGYYSINNEVTIKKYLDNDSSASNITYLHSYLSGDMWSLVSQRITNFGEKACKQIMQKLCVQKLKAMLLFEDEVNDDVVSSIQTAVLSNVEDNWKNLVFDSFVLQKIVASSDCLARFAQLILNDAIKMKKYDQLNLLYESDGLVNAMIYTCLKKINRAYGKKQKKRNSVRKIFLSQQIFAHLSEDFLLNDSSYLNEITDMFTGGIENLNESDAVNVNEVDLIEYVNLMEIIPTVQCKSQEIFAIYLISVLLDLRSCILQEQEVTNKLENIVLGAIKNCTTSFKILHKLSTITGIVTNFTRYDEFASLIFKNYFKSVNNLDQIRIVSNFLLENKANEKYVTCLTLLVEAANKNKKSKVWAENKSALVEFVKEIYTKILDFVKVEVNLMDLVEWYELVLRDNLHSCDENELQVFVKFSKLYLELISQKAFDKKAHKGVVLLLTTLIRNKTKLQMDKNVVDIAWKCCKKMKVCKNYNEEYAKLMVLVFEQMSLEQFEKVVNGLIESLTKILQSQKMERFIENMRLLQHIVSSELGKMKSSSLQNILQTFLIETLSIYSNDSTKLNRETVYQEVVKLEMEVIKNVHIFLEPPLRESIFLTIFTINLDENCSFMNVFGLSVALMESLLKFRKLLTMDYLSSFLQCYRNLLRKLCAKSNSNLGLETPMIRSFSDCAYKFEKLTIKITHCDKDLGRISHYLIADILEQFEKVSLYPSVKIHLTNCLNCLISLCDDKSIAFLKRVLSVASTERFKIIHENYNKYYKFDGKI